MHVVPECVTKSLLQTALVADLHGFTMASRTLKSPGAVYAASLGSMPERMKENPSHSGCPEEAIPLSLPWGCIFLPWTVLTSG